MRRKLLEANMGKQGSKFPDHRAGRALFLELEQYVVSVPVCKQWRLYERPIHLLWP
jgi:hypothetical protein